MTTSNEDFYGSIDGALTPEQAARALALAESGDTGARPEPGGAPTTTAAPDGKADEAGAPTAGGAPAPHAGGHGKGDGNADGNVQMNADNAVLLARDGKHTIPFDRLEKARQGEQHWRAQAQAAQQQLAALQAQAQARADAGQAPTTTDNMVAQAEAAIAAGADADLFGDFSEQELAEGIRKLVAQQVHAQVQAHVGKALEPLHARQRKDAAAAHYDAIYGKHPNADSIVQSEQFKAWVDSHPSAVRNALWTTFDPEKGGSAAEIVEVLDAYAKASTKFSPPPTAADARAAAQAAARAATPGVPASLTAIPGGPADGASPNERLAELDGSDLYAALEGKTPAQIEAFLNQQL